MKERLFDLLEGDSNASRWTNGAILVLIVVSVLSSIFGGIFLDVLGAPSAIRSIELFCIVVFTVEYSVRLWISDWPRQANPRVVHTCLDGLRMRAVAASKPLMVVDLLAILPFWITLFLPLARMNLAWIRIIRLFRVFRLFKLSRYSAATSSIGLIFRERGRELAVLLSFVVLIMLIGANVFWEIEGGQRAIEDETTVKTIGDTFWWAIVTITSTGYGDIIPRSLPGRILAGLLMLVGVGVIAVPAGIVGAALSEMVKKMKLERWKAGNYNNHVIICGWNSTAETLIRELEAAEIDRIVIVARSEVPSEISNRHTVINEDYTKDSVLRHIICRDPDWTHPCLIVLAERVGDQSVEDIDARTLMTTMLAERIAKEQKGSLETDQLYTITQMLGEENARVLRESVATANEVFVSGQVIGSMIANSVLAMGSSDILVEMFSSVGENQLFSVVVSQLRIRKEGPLKWADVDRLLKEQGAIAMGFAVKGDKETIRKLNPEPTTELTTGREIVYYVSPRRLYK